MNEHFLQNIDMRELGAQLRKARERRGLTQKDAAKIIDVARTTIVAIEQGERQIKASELVQLAKAYGRDIGEFVRKTHPASEAFHPQFRAAYKRSNTVEEINFEAIDELERLARNYYELEQFTGDMLKYRYPPEYDLGGFDAEYVAENIAFEERKRLGLGDSPISQLRKILEEEVGLRIFYLPIEPSHYAAIYVYDQLLGGCIAVNIKHPKEKRNWSLAHEYAHFLAHRYLADIFVENYQRLPERERFAEAFANYFLVPPSSLMRQVQDVEGKVTPARLCIWAHYYGVSVQAMTIRLEDMRILPTGTWDELTEAGFRVREAQEQLGLSTSDEEPDKLPVRYRYLAVEALDNELISEGLFTEFLQVDRVKARRIFKDLSRWRDKPEGSI